MFLRRPIPTVIALTAVTAGLVLASGAAGATTAPTAAERPAIIHAFGDPASAAPCLVVRLAASDPDYADVRFRTTQGCQRWAFNGTNVLERSRSGHWKVAFEGSSYPCPVPHIPRQVQRDLGVCPA
jgi:hypothetical protein